MKLRNAWFLSVSCSLLLSASEQAWGSPAPTTTTLEVTAAGSAVTSVAAGSVVTLTATVNSGTASVTLGQVNFCDATATYCTDIHLLGTAQLTSAGTAAIAFRPGIGSHSYKAVFLGTPNGSPAYSSSASSPAALTVTGKYATVTVISGSGTAGNYTLTATVTGSSATAVPTGTISFLDTNQTNTLLGTATLIPGSPGPSFLFPPLSTPSNAPSVLAVGDFNGDGIPDLAASAFYDSTLTIFLGNGDGTFTQAVTNLATVPNAPTFLAMGDFNGDGKQDLVILSNDDESATILLGNGDGTFTQAPGSPFTVGETNGQDSAAVGDFNGDGKADLMIANSNQVTILLGSGDGTFLPASGSPMTVVPDGGTYAVAVGDFNRDGILDFAVAGVAPVTQANPEGGVTLIFLGKGDGTFTQAADSPIAVGAQPTSVAVGDFNGDGAVDLAVMNAGNSGTLTILLGKGDGTFNQASGTTPPLGMYPQSLTIGDFNADGKADLAILNGNDESIWVWLGNGDGTFTPNSNLLVPETYWDGSLGAGDFNGDGVTDIVATTGEANALSVFLTQLSQSTAALTGISVTGGNILQADYPGDSNDAPSLSESIDLSSSNLPAPVISPAAGPVSSTQFATISDAAPGATIYYEYLLNGFLFTNGFVPYTGPIPLEGDATETIWAYATEAGYEPSSTVSAAYTINFSTPAATPELSLASGYYSGPQTVTISDTTPGAAIYYSTNGSYPYRYTSLYTGPFTVSASEVVAAIAMAPGYRNSAEATGQYSIGSSASRFIYTVAGNYAPGYTGDGGPATLAEVNGMQGVAVDGAGNVYMADSGDNVVRKVDASTGIITTIAGTGAAGHSGDNGPATSAELWAPTALAVDAAGDLFVAETGDNVVRRIDAISGQITTFAGDPAGTFTTEGPATGYLFEQIVGLACDPLGNLYIEQHFNVLEVDASSGNIAEVAGNDTQYRFSQLDGIAVDSHGNVYVADEYAGWIWLLRANAVPIVFAGGSEAPGGGDGGPATEASLSFPSGLAVDGVGNLYIADLFDCTIREVNTNGMINTVAGIFDNWGFTGADGLPAANGILNWVQTLASDAAGNLYIADTKTNRIRKVTAPAAPPRTPVATPVFSLAASAYSSPQTLTITDATPGAEIYVTLDGSAPNTADQGYHGPIEITGAVTVQAVALAPGYVVSAPVSAAYTITAPPPAVISTVAGDGTEGFSGSGGLATNTEIGEPKAIAFDSAGNLYIADTAYSVVWKVAASTGIISIVAGTGTSENSGCYNGVATSTVLNEPDGIAFDKAGNLYISDAGDYCVRMVSAETGQISTVAGPGISTTIGDGSPATEAYLGVPGGLAFDAAGNLYIADGSINRVRMIAASTGNISTVAGYGEAGARGDGGLATLAELSDPLDVTVDGLGNLYIMDSGDNRIRKVTKSTGVIDTIAGNGVMGNTGDGGAAVAANINAQQGIALDSAGNVYFSNSLDTVREVSATTGMIRSVAGDGYFGYSGDGGAATMAELWVPQGLAFDAAGSLYIADSYNASVRKVGTPQLQSQNIAFTPPSPLYFGIPPITLSATGGTSGNPVTFSIVSGPGSLSGTNDSVLDVTGTGAIVVAANQAGDAGYAAAPQVIASIAVVSPAAATITSPASGTVLAGSSVTFAWSGAAEPTGYYLLIGSTGVGSNNIYNSAEKTVTTYTFPYMPTDGAKIYVRLFTNFNGNWLHNDYTYTAALRGTPMTSPAPGTSLGGSGVTFNWSAASGATGYFLWIGTTGVGSSNLYYSAEKTVTTYNFDHLPTNGGTIYVRLTTNYNGTWVYNDYTYTVSPPAVLTAPVSGSTLNGPNVTFDWQASTGATGYYLWIGSTGVGSNNIYNSAEKTVTSYTFTRVPTNGETIYVRLITNYSGTWLHNDYTYTASTQAAMTSPAPASTFIGSSVTFTWSAASGATGYYLQIGSTGVGSDDIYNSAEKTVTAYTFSRMPTNGETIYVRLTTNYNGTWLHEDYVYTAQ